MLVGTIYIYWYVSNFPHAARSISAKYLVLRVLEHSQMGILPAIAIHTKENSITISKNFIYLLAAINIEHSIDFTTKILYLPS